MSVLMCKMCGGNLIATDVPTICECDYCGRKQTVPTLDDERKVNLFKRANKLRFNNEFDVAARVFENIVAEYPNEAEAFWGLCLCKYGIEYVEDPRTHERKPTCHRTNFDSIFDDENFIQACECSETDARKIYRDEAKEIERIQHSILDIAKNESPYDVFICYKETAENGERTKDSVLAQDIYTALAKEGYKVFFARISLEDKLGQEYEPYIFSALNTAKVMLVIGTDYEHFNAVWVRNEWSRFLDMRKTAPEKVLIPCYADIDPYDMPREFKNLQGQDMGKVGFLQDLIRGIGKIIPAKGTVTEENNSFSQSDVKAMISDAVSAALTASKSTDTLDFSKYSDFAIDGTKLQKYLGNSQNVNIPQGVTSIGEKAFVHNKDLVSVIIPAGVTSIGKGAFYGCDSLRNISIPDGVTLIDDDAFSSCYSLPEINLPQSIVSVGDNVFNGCRSLRFIHIPNGLKSIGNAAFANSGITGVKLPDSITSIGGNLGLGNIVLTANNPSYQLQNGFIFTKDMKTLVSAPPYLSGEYIIPNGVTTIGRSAFHRCTGLTSVVIPSSVTAIEKLSFASTGLKSIVLPDSIVSIGANAFVRCNNLTCIVIPNSVVSIGQNAFIMCKNLTSISIPDSVTDLGDDPFDGCIKLSSIVIPKRFENDLARLDIDVNKVRVSWSSTNEQTWSLNNEKIKQFEEEQRRIDEENRIKQEQRNQQQDFEHKRLMAERHARREALKEEKASLELELTNLKGLFSGKRKREIESRLQQIEVEMQRLNSGR